MELKEIDGDMYRVGEAVLNVTIPVQPNAGNDELFFDYPYDAISLTAHPFLIPEASVAVGSRGTLSKSHQRIGHPIFRLLQ